MNKRFRDALLKCTVYINKAPSNGLTDMAGPPNWVVTHSSALAQKAEAMAPDKNK